MLTRSIRKPFATARDILKRKQERQRADLLLSNNYHRVDMAFLVRRSPIHVMINDAERKANLIEYETLMKYKQLPEIDNCLNDIKSNFSYLHSNWNDRASTFYRQLNGEEIQANLDKLATQEKHGILREQYEQPLTGIHEEKLHNDREYFFGRSKEYFHADPYTTNTKSIHYASCYSVYLLVFDTLFDKWTIPSYPIPAEHNFTRMKDKMYLELPGPNATFHYVRSYPSHVHTKELLPQEKNKSSVYKRIKSKRVFTYEMYHHNGTPQLDSKRFTDWAWVPVPEMYKYVDQETYDEFKLLLTPF